MLLLLLSAAAAAPILDIWLCVGILVWFRVTYVPSYMLMLAAVRDTTNNLLTLLFSNLVHTRYRVERVHLPT